MRELIALSPAVRDDLARELRGLGTLQDVVRWSFSRARDVADVVIQDEYTHDVVVPYSDALYLVFDTT